MGREVKTVKELKTLHVIRKGSYFHPVRAFGYLVEV